MALPSLDSSKKEILLLIAQHFQGGFAEDGEIERGFLHRGIGENDLMRQRGFAATGRARDDVEGKFRDAAAQDVVEPAHAGRQFVDRDFSGFAHDFFGSLSLAALFCFFIFTSVYRNPNR